jgi:hypothetical protein
MLPMADFLTCVWLACCAAYSLWSLAKGSRQSLHYVVLVHVLFCGVPLVLDLYVGPPHYHFSRRLTEVSQDETTSLIYCFYVSMAPVIWFAMARRQRRRGELMGESQEASSSGASLAGRKRWVLPLLYAMMISPALLVFVSPNPAMYLEYAPVVRGSPAIADAEFQTRWVALAALAGILACGGAMVLVPRITTAHACFFAACLFQGVWLQAKRFSIALAVVCVVFALWQRGTLRGIRFAIACAIAFVTMGAASYWYQDYVRGQNIADTPDYYDGYRADYGRDGVIKQAIYSELHPEEGRILQYRGQNIVYLLTFYVPRSMWPTKPWTYSTYVTAALMEQPDPYYLGYVMTTSILDEALATFGWLGLVMGPWLVGVVCRLGDQSRWPPVRLLTAAVGPLLLVLDVGTFIVVFLAWLGLALYSQSWGRAEEAKVGLAEESNQRLSPDQRVVLSPVSTTS